MLEKMALECEFMAEDSCGVTGLGYNDICAGNSPVREDEMNGRFSEKR